jgi:hypothetical protein
MTNTQKFRINISLILFFSTSLILKAQDNQISLNSGYTNQSYYSMQNGEVLNVSNEDWDIAFSTDIFSETIRINDGKGVELYTYHLGDTSSWSSINNSTTNILINRLYNSDSDWNSGAFGNNEIGGFDYGWGVYNLQTHHIIGDSLFVMKTVNGNWKKLWLQRKVSGEYFFTHSNLDGSSSISENVLASDFFNKRFLYYSLDNNTIVDREPILSDWDITFTKYITPVQGIPYSVTGVLSNSGIKVAEADGIFNPFTYTNYSLHNFDSDINVIGYDWKQFTGSFPYLLDPNRCFFVKDYQENIWRIIFTGFDGMSTGNIEFNTELLATTSIGDIVDDALFRIYPNPAIDNQDITLVYDMREKNSVINIYDISGRIVYSSNLDSKGFKSHTIPSNVLEHGVYIISLNHNGKILNERLIVN